MKALAPLALALAAGTAAADTDLARCRAIAEPAARLACYDAIAAASPVGSPAASAATFGFENRIAQSGPEAIESRIPGLFEGWSPNQRIRLENGQVWQVSDDSRGVLAVRDAKVKVTRGAMGSFFLEIEGRRQAPRVRRVE